MSEQYIYVACTCFREGRTTPPPVPRSGLTLDSYGNVVLLDGTHGDDFSEELFDWMSDRACPHYFMREIDTIFHPYLEYSAPALRGDRELQFPRVVEELDSGRYPALTQLLDQFPHAHGIVATPTQSAQALQELDEFERVPLEATTRILVDEHNARLWPIIDPEGYEGSLGFSALGRGAMPESSREDLIELGVDGNDLVVRVPGGDELLRSRILEPRIGTDTIVVDYQVLNSIAVVDPETGRSVTGFGWGIAYQSWDNFHEPERRYPSALRVAEAPLFLADTVYFPGPLRAALETSVATQNPVVTFYSGHSLGFELAPT